MKNDLTRILVNIILAEPFFGHLAANLLREYRDDLPDTGLVLQPGGTIILGINPEFWDQKDLDDEQRFGAIKHELLHLALLHPFRQPEFAREDLFSIAADLVANQYISGDQLRPGQITLSALSSVDWQAHQGVAYYYRLLEEVLQHKIRISREDSNAIDQWLDEEHPAQLRHQFWMDALEDLSQSEKGALAAIWQHQIKDLVSREAAASFYRLDLPLRELIYRTINRMPASLDWKRVLRMFATNSRKMVLKDTIRRPSKRYGTVPGTKIKRHQKLMVALDTSGSLSAAMLREFFREIYLLWRTGAELTIVECDDQIRDQYPYRGQQVREVSGRGSTAFDAPIRLANEKRLDGLVYLTDGFGPVPEVSPRIPMLWMISRDGIRADSRTWAMLPGRVVRMDISR